MNFDKKIWVGIWACGEKKRIKWEGQRNLIKSSRLKHWLGLSCLNLAIKSPSSLGESKCAFKSRGDCMFLSVSRYVPSTLQSCSKGREDSRILYNWSLTCHWNNLIISLAWKSFNYVVINCSDAFAVTVSSVVALYFAMYLTFSMALYVDILLFQIWNAYIMEIALFYQVNIAIILPH